jgi:ketosteroid isomerase-like protein
MSNESEIRELIENWAKAVHAGDMDGVLANHADDIVMFDVPPPEDGVRGIDAYRETWPPFFEWQKQGALLRSSRSKSLRPMTSPSRTGCSAAEDPKS